MSKFRIPNNNSSVDPFQQLAEISGMDLIESPKTTPYDGYYTNVPLSEDLSTLDDENKYSLFGNSQIAQNAINESKVNQQGALELVGKGIYNIGRSAVFEVLKTPGYLGGVVGATGNEIFGEGKNSMSYIVDNFWINAFDSLDEEAKALVPTYVSNDLQEGNLLDKMSSGAWWASTASEGLGFMLGMMVPGRGLASIGAGAKLAVGAEKVATGLNLSKTLGLFAKTPQGLKYTADFARNLDGILAASVNTVTESAAEAKNTFDNLTNKYLQEGLSEEEAKAKAGEGASAVFKTNMAILAASNLFDEIYIWKTLGSPGNRQAAKQLVDNKIDDLSLVSNLSRSQVLKRYGINAAKSILKEGFFEEGLQTSLQQAVESGKSSTSLLENLQNTVNQYITDFEDNGELHESIFLGGLLGGGMSLYQTAQENKSLKEALYGSPEKTKDNSLLVKYGLASAQPAQKGLFSILKEDHIKRFNSYKDLLTDGKLDEQKLADAQLDNVQEIITQYKYDAAVASGNLVEQEVYGQFLAANAARNFLQQEGGQELFETYVDNQVKPAWTSRFQETFGRQPSQSETSAYVEKYKRSGKRVFNAHKEAEQTNYPERYIKENLSPEFRQLFFHKKFQTLVALDAVKEKKADFNAQLISKGLVPEDLEKLSDIKDPVVLSIAKGIKKEYDVLSELEKELSNEYSSLFTKEGVTDFYNNFSKQREVFENLRQEQQKTNQELKQKADKRSETNKDVGLRIINSAAELGYISGEEIQTKDRYGNTRVFQTDGENIYTTNDIGEKVSIEEISQELGKLDITPVPKGREATAEDFSFGNIEEFKFGDIDALAQEIISNTTQEPTILDARPEIPSLEERTEREVFYERVSRKMFFTSGQHHVFNLGKPEFEETENGWVPKLNSSFSQKLWFEEMNNIVTAEHYLEVVVNESNIPELQKQIRLNNPNPTGQDIYVVLKNKNDDSYYTVGGNYVFTAIRQPDSMYPEKNGKFLQPRVLMETIVLNFLKNNAVTQSYLDFQLNWDSIPNTVLEKLGSPKSFADLNNNAIKFAKNQYTEWFFQLLTSPKGSRLEILSKTKGFPVEVYEDSEGKKPKLQSLYSLKDFKMKDGKIISGTLHVAKSTVTEVGNETIATEKGDTLYVHSDGSIHILYPNKLGNLTRDVLHIIALQENEENLKLEDEYVFYNPEDPKNTIISRYIHFGKTGFNGEIYFDKESIKNKNPKIVYRDFDGNVKSLKVETIRQAIFDNDYSAVQDFLDFLSKKKININDYFLNSKVMRYVPLINRDVKGNKFIYLDKVALEDYQAFILNHVNITATNIEGYPNRLQINLNIDNNIISPIKTEEIISLSNDSEDKLLNDFIDFKVDKVLSVDDLLEQKLRNNEIVKKCQ